MLLCFCTTIQHQNLCKSGHGFSSC